MLWSDALACVCVLCITIRTDKANAYLDYTYTSTRRTGHTQTHTYSVPISLCIGMAVEENKSKRSTSLVLFTSDDYKYYCCYSCITRTRACILCVLCDENHDMMTISAATNQNVNRQFVAIIQ